MCNESTLVSDKQTVERSRTEASDIQSEAMSSESECQLAELNEVTRKLSASMQNLEATKAVYSIGISLDPEEFAEDEQITRPGECFLNTALIEVVVIFNPISASTRCVRT